MEEEIKAPLAPEDINRYFLHALVRLKGKCLIDHNNLIQMAEAMFEYERSNESTFFSSMSDVIDILIVYLMNEERSKMEPYEAVLESILNDAILNNGNPLDEVQNAFVEIGRRDVQALFNERMNFVTSSNFMDFTVSSFSAFEFWMDKIYVPLRKSIPSSGKKKKELIDHIEMYGKETDKTKRDLILDKIMNECSSYVPSANKIAFILTRVGKSYARDPKKDKQLVTFYGARRNTVHNGGIHIKKSLDPIEIKGKFIKLDKGKPASSDDLATFIHHCEELVDIYASTVMALRIPDLSCYINTDDHKYEKPQ